ncbi:MAG: hypothetical protein PHT33_08065, partial [bacterium]|nr:hypothetical protein [bacterium]
MHLYFFDDEYIAHKSDLARVPGPVDRLGTILESDDYWYDVFAGTIIPLDGGGWRAYMDAYKKGNDICSNSANSGVVVCESSNGIDWHEVPLNFYSDPSVTSGRIKMENIPSDYDGVFIQPQVVPIEDGCRMYAWFHGSRGGFPIKRFIAADSADGYTFALRDFDKPAVYHPGELGPRRNEAGLAPADFAAANRPVLAPEEVLHIKRLRSNDATYVYYSEEKKEYIMYTPFLLPNLESNPRSKDWDSPRGVVRSISMRTSRDGISFSDPQLLLVPDECDPLDRQLYHMSVHRQDGWHVGFIGDYRILDQTVDIQLAFSRDGVSWQRPMRTPFFARGGEGSFDSTSIAAASSLIDAGDDWILMYNGRSTPHNYLGEHSFSPGLARFGKRRFMGLRTGGGASFLLTKPFILTEPEITVDADIKGLLYAELCDAFGIPIAGYRREDFIPLNGDSRKHVLGWKSKTTQDYRYDAVSLRLEITDGTVYA